MILAKTVKGYGLGEAGEGKNVTHQQKKLNEDELRIFRDRFDIPVTDEELGRGRLLPPAREQPGDPVPPRAPARPGRTGAAAAGAQGAAGRSPRARTSGGASSRGSTATSRRRWSSCRS